MLAVGGVAVIGALLFDMLLLSRGLLVSFRDLLDTAGFDIRVVASEGSLVHRRADRGRDVARPRRSRGCRRCSASLLIRTDNAPGEHAGAARPRRCA